MIFTAPLALLGLAILPPLYFILRLTPPAPRRQRFPPLALLQNLPDTQQTTHRLPLWMLLLRLTAAMSLILGFAGPTLHPPPILPGSGPVLLVIDNGWASAVTWSQSINSAETILSAAEAQNRGVAILATARDPSGAAPHIQGVFSAATGLQIISAMQPEPWPTDRSGAAAALQPATETTRLYLSDGITDGPGFQSFLKTLHPNRIFSPHALPPLLAPPSLTANGHLTVHTISNPLHAALLAESANGGILARAPFDTAGNAAIDMPMPIANQITKFVLDGPPTAGGTALSDSTTHTALAALVTGSANAESPFLGTLYFLRRALPPDTQVITGTLERVITSKPGLIFLADTPLTQPQQAEAGNYISDGGILVRFAGPLTTESPDKFSAAPLIAGDRHLGGALTWTTPENLAPFPTNTPFAGLSIDPKTSISQQILADPTTLDPATVWATLHDGTPLILGKAIGHGYLVNILTTANTGWANLALSGLYPALLSRLLDLSEGIPENPNSPLPLRSALNAFGGLNPPGITASLTLARRNVIAISSVQPPGLYGNGTGSIALNLGNHISAPVAASLPGAAPLGNPTPPRRLGPDLIALAVLLLGLDLILSLALRGAIPLRRLAFLIVFCLPVTAKAQTAALQTELGYIVTNNAITDHISADGLTYLSAYVSAHSSVQLSPPAALNPSTDDLSFYPLIYWPLLPNAPTPSPASCTALTTYMNHGGLLVIDSPGGDMNAQGSGAGFAPGATATFTRVTSCLNLPPLEALSTANVLAHCFYIIPDFSGRFTGAPVLVATSAALDADGVTPVIVGQNDWASAWARDASGAPEQTPIPGGEDQRIIADRFGLNLVIYALTGSYKSNQNSAPTLLDELGQ
jgi:Domain of unknown function (DUF4159)/Aerotolerance regulator N-terminal